MEIDGILDIIENGLPADNAFLNYFIDGGKFTRNEGDYWDYKASYNAEKPVDQKPYREQINKTILAFHNTFGGLLIFGVDDKTRETIKPEQIGIGPQETERHSWITRNNFSAEIKCEYQRYSLPVDDKSDKNAKSIVHVWRIPKRSEGTPPVFFKKPVEAALDEKTDDKNPADCSEETLGTSEDTEQENERPKGKQINKVNKAIYFRSGDSVRHATSRDFPFLYSSRELENSEHSVDIQRQSEVSVSYLPPNPATVKSFVDRYEEIHSLYKWLFNPDEVSMAVWGTAGSGKSTIAYEFARQIRNYGNDLKLSQNRPVDAVIFLSAKKLRFDAFRGEAQQVEAEFEDATSLYRTILFHCEWEGRDAPIDELSEKELEDSLKELFNSELELFLVLDDLDTLTTAGVNPGTNFIYQQMCRAQRGKLLFTFRNEPPLHGGIDAQVAVPGLNKDGEYPDFIEACCERFEQQPPSDEKLLQEIYDETEGRPLAIENITGLRRNVSAWTEAIKEFVKTDGSEDFTNYVFDREYRQLEKDGQDARLILAALSLLKEPASFSDIEFLVGKPTNSVLAGIDRIKAMFLKTVQNPVRNKSENSDEIEQLFSLRGELTKAFIATRREDLNYYEQLNERVKNFQRQGGKATKAIQKLQNDIHRLYEGYRDNPATDHWKDIGGAWKAVNRKSYGHEITETWEFKILKAYVAASSRPPKISEMRAEVGDIIKLSPKKLPDQRHLRAIYYAELHSGHGYNQAIELCDFVLTRGIQENFHKTKSEWNLKKSMALSRSASAKDTESPDASFNNHKEACLLAAGAYWFTCENPETTEFDKRNIKSRAENVFEKFIDFSFVNNTQARALTEVKKFIVDKKLSNSAYLDFIVTPIETNRHRFCNEVDPGLRGAIMGVFGEIQRHLEGDAPFFEGKSQTTLRSLIRGYLKEMRG